MTFMGICLVNVVGLPFTNLVSFLFSSAFDFQSFWKIATRRHNELILTRIHTYSFFFSNFTGKNTLFEGKVLRYLMVLVLPR